MFGWRNPKRPDVVAFDAIGTMFPLDPMRPALMTLGLARSGLEGWYATAVHDALALTACGDFKPFTAVMEGALDQVLGEQGLAPPRSARRALLAQFKHLPARPDARDALQPRAASTDASDSADQRQRSRDLVPVAAIGAGQVG